jgi:hypothetical protein
MKRLSHSALEKHWADLNHRFRSRYRTWIAIFWDLVSEVSKIGMYLEHKSQLAENCSFLLLSKALNHALAMISLAQRGLCIDAALASRSAVETLLLLELLLLDASEGLFQKWSDGEEFKPAWVRKELESRSPSTVKEVVVTIGQETHDLNRLIYRWLSEITHANLDSLNHTVMSMGGNSFEVSIGGSLDGRDTLLNAVFAITCHGLHSAAILCIAVFDPIRLKNEGLHWSSLEKRMNEANEAARR